MQVVELDSSVYYINQNYFNQIVEESTTDQYYQELYYQWDNTKTSISPIDKQKSFIDNMIYPNFEDFTLAQQYYWYYEIIHTHPLVESEFKQKLKNFNESIGALAYIQVDYLSYSTLDSLYYGEPEFVDDFQNSWEYIESLFLNNLGEGLTYYESINTQKAGVSNASDAILQQVNTKYGDFLKNSNAYTGIIYRYNELTNRSVTINTLEYWNNIPIDIMLNIIPTNWNVITFNDLKA